MDGVRSPRLGIEPLKHIRKVLIANRGEIAVRCIRACAACGVKSVAIYTEADATSLHVSLADESVALPGTNSTGYLQIQDIIQICSEYQVDAVIPGYGFLSENETFARKIVDAGMVFVGPSIESILEMGLKHRARDLAISANVPVVPGTDLLTSKKDAIEAANRIGFPVMLKASAGGGGMGLQICYSEAEIAAAYVQVTSRGKTLFQNAGVFLEKYYAFAHHIEVQVFGNGVDVIHFGERECSIQRRHQKVIEECPSPFVEAHPGLRERITLSAVDYASLLKYKSAGTVEFLVDDITGDYFFLEMNTRIQVEHPITEMCYGIDLVALMLRQADFEKGGSTGIPSSDLLLFKDLKPAGSAIEARLYAENPYRGFSPAPGLLQDVQWASGDGVRIEAWVKTGQNVTPYYDPLLAKVITHASDRPKALGKMAEVLSHSKVHGPPTNVDFLRSLVVSSAFQDGRTTTNFLSEAFIYRPCAIDVISPGAFTTIQDYPGRPAMGHGIPQGGPMDSISFRVANLLVGNAPGVEALEITISGPELLFTASAVIAICGAPLGVTVDGKPEDMWARFSVSPGQRVTVGAIKGGGCRAYLAVRGGFPEVPKYLGSKSTTPGLKYGGIQGRQLQANDFILLSPSSCATASETEKYSLPTACIPDYDISCVYVMHGPHDSDDIMTAADREMLYTTKWRVGHNSNRTGIRFEGPKPTWARSHGGEGGSHPSNIIDYGYPSPGGVNWTGDNSVAFTMDSPNLGGLICSSTVVSADLWRLGQLKPGDFTQMRPISYAQARELSDRVDSFIQDLAQVISGATGEKPELDLNLDEEDPAGAILRQVPAYAGRPQAIYRQGGDCSILLELGEQRIDVLLAVRIRLITSKLAEAKLPSVTFVPNVNSVLVAFDPKLVSQKKILQSLSTVESSIELTGPTMIRTREIHLPMVLDHPALQEAISQYMATTRPTAAYLPDNIEYLRRNNGLRTRREAFERCLDVPFLIVAVGFLCGAPELLPLSPMSQLQAQKYNPSRTFTPGGAVGMGGSLFSMYPVDQPGGYMLVGRTVEGWDTYGTKPGYSPTRPWLYEPFDIVYFHEVSLDEYTSILRTYFAGKFQYDIRESVFDVDTVVTRLENAKHDPAWIAFKRAQKKSVGEQLALENTLYTEWQARQQADAAQEALRLKELVSEDLDPAMHIVSPMDANVWKVLVGVGDVLNKGQVVCILEAMKMEINVSAPEVMDGATVKAVATKPGNTVAPGTLLIVGHMDK